MSNSILQIIADNKALFDAVEALLEEEFSLDGVSTDLSNEEMGQVVRARVDGIARVRAAFKKIEHFRSVEKKPTTQNPAR